MNREWCVLLQCQVVALKIIARFYLDWPTEIQSVKFSGTVVPFIVTWTRYPTGNSVISK